MLPSRAYVGPSAVSQASVVVMPSGGASGPAHGVMTDEPVP